MSKIFFDHLVVLSEVELKMSSCDYLPGEKEKVHHLIEETITYRVITKILDHLPREHHEEFLKRFHAAPHHASLMSFLKERVENIEDYIREEVKDIELMFLADIESSKRAK
ncbi:MAG: hypothetical protein Q7S03_00940 [bacterium]|nr:hypothetical protein [bacterium]